MSHRACFDMADDEEAVVPACTSLVFSALDLHQSQEQLLEKVGGYVNSSPRCGDVPEHVTCESRLSWRACRRQARRSTSRLFLCQNAWAIQIACRVVTWRNQWNVGFGLERPCRVVWPSLLRQPPTPPNNHVAGKIPSKTKISVQPLRRMIALPLLFDYSLIENSIRQTPAHAVDIMQSTICIRHSDIIRKFKKITWEYKKDTRQCFTL